MRCNNGNHATGAKDEPATAGLDNCIGGFFPDLGLVSKNNGSLTNATADHAPVDFQRVCQRWTGFTVMPVDNLENGFREQGLGDQIEVYVETM